MRTSLPAVCFALAASSQALGACGEAPDGSRQESSSTHADSSSSTAGSSTGVTPTICGAPGDEASTDDQIAALEGCDTYRGTLMMLSDVSTVAPLSALRVLEGELFLGGTDSPLTTLQGLEQLESVGALTFTAHNVQNLLPLAGLQEVKSNFSVSSMFNLVDLRGLDGLRSVGGNFLLFANTALISVDGLEGLETVGGDFEAGSYMTPLPRSEAQALVDRIEIGGAVNID
jgi:hypothetical protein